MRYSNHEAQARREFRTKPSAGDSAPVIRYKFFLPRSTRRSRRVHTQFHFVPIVPFVVIYSLFGAVPLDYVWAYFFAINLYQPRGLNTVVDQREELPLLSFGYPIGSVPAASRGIRIKFFFVSFVPFVVIFSLTITCFLSLKAFSGNVFLIQSRPPRLRLSLHFSR